MQLTAALAPARHQMNFAQFPRTLFSGVPQRPKSVTQRRQPSGDLLRVLRVCLSAPTRMTDGDVRNVVPLTGVGRLPT